LRTKESDRIAAIERMLGTVGVAMDYERGTLRITGPAGIAQPGTVATQGDHRTAMAAAVLGCAAGPVTIDSDDSFEVSFPGFLSALERLLSP
jgi:3-phosphoshikimate 1-carboxyvinyltransferase